MLFTWINETLQTIYRKYQIAYLLKDGQQICNIGRDMYIHTVLQVSGLEASKLHIPVALVCPFILVLLLTAVNH